MKKKHFKKQVVRNTQEKCVSCSKVLTTIDMCYSNDVRKCWNCDKENKEKDLFGLAPQPFKKCSANCSTSEHSVCLCYIEFMNKK